MDSPLMYNPWACSVPPPEPNSWPSPEISKWSGAAPETVEGLGFRVQS